MQAQGARLSLRVWFFSVLALFGVLWLSIPWVGGERAGLLEDDAYFYAQIAYNSQHVGRYSFDGLHVTSGFHPLWMALLSATAHGVSLFTQDKTIHLAVYLTLWFVLVLALAVRVGRSRLERVVFVALALLTTPLMETALLSLLLVLAAERVLCAPRQGFDRALCGLAFLIPLTRIDMAPLLVLWLLLVRNERAVLLSLGLGLGLGVLAHFTYLEAAFGHPYTVSSLLKTRSLTEGLLLFRATGKSGILVRLLVLIVLVAWAAVTLRRLGRTRYRLALLGGAPIAFTLGHVAVSQVRAWYFLPAYAFAFWAGTRGGSSSSLHSQFNSVSDGQAHREFRSGWLVVVLMATLLNLYKVYRFIPLDHVRQASWEFVLRGRHLLPPDARIYQVDGSGFTGYWLERQLVNGDGLVNTYEYARRLRAKKLAGYLGENGICYLVTDAPVGDRQKYLVDLSGLRVKRSSAEEVLRSTAYGWSKNPNAHFILWRLRDARCPSG